ncbi:hypothetical protein BC828DRAFT_390040 [Blastocladiella britannica]|nr:hypothetical protein BC828DRAFT_390040 [Blastocladiella britannica]
MVEPIVTALPTPQPQPPQSQRISDGSMTGSAVPQQPMTPPSTSPMASPRVSAQHRSSFLGDLPRDGSNSPSLGGRHLSMSGGAMDTPRVVVPISVIPRSPVVAGSGARTPPQVTRTPSVMSSPSSAPSNVGGGAGGEFANSVIKSRVYHDGQTYVLLLSSGLSYSSLLAMVKRKVGRPATTDVRVKFEDDSGDFILIGGDEDVRTALALAWGRAQAAMSAAGGALSIASAPAALNLFVFDI